MLRLQGDVKPEQAEKRVTTGRIIQGLALNLPVGLGEPHFDTLEGEMAKSFSIRSQGRNGGRLWWALRIRE